MKKASLEKVINPLQLLSPKGLNRGTARGEMEDYTIDQLINLEIAIGTPRT